ncbi:MAG: NAD(+) synthase, partial [Treponema sp.]|nr:NAD(+) synthase [Treponema sp.]
MTYEFLRAACASPDLRVADCKFNADEIIKTVKDADAMGVRVLALPELCITGYTCSDLFLQTTLLDSAKSALLRIANETKDCGVLFSVGLPLLVQGSLFNCAALVFSGNILAVIPKMNIPNYAEFYEMRHFSPASSKCQGEISLGEKFDSVPFGTDILIEDKNSSEIKIAVEICEDLWVPLSPSTRAALSSATLILNPSASNETVGKAEYRRLLVQGQSSKSICAYLYADAGHDESSTDMIFSGHNIIALNGNVCAESALFDECGKILVTDLDMGRIEQDRLRIKSFRNNADAMLSDPYGDFRIITVSLKDNGFALGKSSAQSSIGFAAKKTTDEKSECELLAKIPEHPFVPSDKEKRGQRC